MATITFKGNPTTTSGDLPPVGSILPDFEVTAPTLADFTLASLGDQRKVLNIFPSLDTGICAMSVRRFNSEAAAHPEAVIVNISADLPFAHRRFCTSEGIERAKNASTFRSTFARDLGLAITSGPMAGLCSRVVLVLDGQNRVVYSEQVPEIAQEPNYEAALAALTTP
jgi:thiol peroxidase